MQQFDHGPPSTETREQFIDRHGKQLVALLKRHLRLLSWFRLPAPRGRRPRLDREPRPKKRSGGQVTFTPEIEQSFLAEINAWKAGFADRGLACSDADALRLSIISVRAGRQFDDEARRLKWVTAIARLRAELDVTIASAVRHFAKAKAPKLDRSPLFRRRKEHLSRLRTAARKARR